MTATLEVAPTPQTRADMLDDAECLKAKMTLVKNRLQMMVTTVKNYEKNKQQE